MPAGAVVGFTMSPVQAGAVPIAVHSYTRIDADPRQFINGSIPAGQTTAQLVVPRIECGQLDIKAVDVTPGSPAGLIGSQQVTWGDVCPAGPDHDHQHHDDDPGADCSTAAPTSVRPTQVPTSSGRVTSTLPATGPSPGGTPWALGLLVLAVGCGPVVLPRRSQRRTRFRRVVALAPAGPAPPAAGRVGTGRAGARRRSP